jgi:AhpD family alkylhydroperoxidase
MEAQDREKIERIHRDRVEAHRRLLATGSRSYRAFLELEKAAYSDGALARKHKELIAVGISLITDCESCLDWHIYKALESGATKEQVLEAIEVGIEMGGGPATVSSRFALKALDYHTEKR